MSAPAPKPPLYVARDQRQEQEERASLERSLVRWMNRHQRTVAELRGELLLALHNLDKLKEVIRLSPVLPRNVWDKLRREVDRTRSGRS